MKTRIPIAALALVVLAMAAAASPEDETHSHKKMEFPGATMARAYEAEELYTCPMHAEVISDDAELPCPLCEMKLEKLSEEETAELRGHELHGCPMCPIVRGADEKDEGCPVCGMKLVFIEHDCEALHGEHGHGMHDGEMHEDAERHPESKHGEGMEDHEGHHH